MEFSEKLKEWMKRTGYKTETAAEHLGISRRTLYDWLQPEGHRPHRALQQAIEQKISTPPLAKKSTGEDEIVLAA